MIRKFLQGLVVTCLLIGPPARVSAMGYIVSGPTNLPISTVQFQQALDVVRQLNHFKASIRMTDLSRDWTIAETTVYGDQEEGLLELTSHFNERKDKYGHVVAPELTLKLLGQDYLQTMAVNYGELSSDMVLFDKTYYPNGDSDQIALDKDCYLVFNNTSSIEGAPPKFIDLFMVRPDPEKMKEMDDALFHSNGEIFQMMGARIQLPLELFQQATYFNYRLKVDWDQSLQSETSFQAENVGIQNEIAFDKASPIDYIEMLLGQSSSKRQWMFAWDSQLSLEKLTHAWIQVDPFNQQYILKTRGVRQDVDMNLLEEATATFELREYLLEIEIEPYDKTIETIDNKNTMTWEQWDARRTNA